tara:strand:- start:2536 stop:3141 length:606 start_codon:yes stop_codon:yes gene_type:complete
MSWKYILKKDIEKIWPFKGKQPKPSEQEQAEQTNQPQYDMERVKQYRAEQNKKQTENNINYLLRTIDQLFVIVEPDYFGTRRVENDVNENQMVESQKRAFLSIGREIKDSLNQASSQLSALENNDESFINSLADASNKTNGLITSLSQGRAYTPHWVGDRRGGQENTLTHLGNKIRLTIQEYFDGIGKDSMAEMRNLGLIK